MIPTCSLADLLAVQANWESRTCPEFLSPQLKQIISIIRFNQLVLSTCIMWQKMTKDINYFPASGEYCRLLISFANSLDPDSDGQNVSPDLDLYRLTLALIVCLKKACFEETSAHDNKKHVTLPCMQRVLNPAFEVLTAATINNKCQIAFNRIQWFLKRTNT